MTGRKTRLRGLASALKTRYWKPGDDYLEIIADSVREVIEDGDLVTVSEKAISTALGNILDESEIEPGRAARILARYWVRYIWGYILGPLCHLKAETIRRIRAYPLREGSIHKEVVLRHLGPIYALHWGSEGGIDASNLPYSYVSLPLRRPEERAREIREHLTKRLGRRVTVMIVDTDKTYSIGRSIHICPRQSSLKGIKTLPGPIAYILGRALRLRRRSTPIALDGLNITADLALEMAEVVNRLRGSGAGRTVWEMAERFGVEVTEVTWEMLESVEHRPIVILKLSRLRRPKERKV